MKALKFVINGEEQNLASESGSAGVCYIQQNPSTEDYDITQGELKEDALVLIDASPFLTDEITIDGRTIEVVGYNNKDGGWIDGWTTTIT